MEERTIKRLALLSLIIGLAFLAYYAWNYNSAEDDLSIQENAAQPKENRRISVTGKVVRIDQKGKVKFIRLSPASKYQLVSFDELDLKTNEEVKLTGRFQTYKGKPEIIIDKITRK